MKDMDLVLRPQLRSVDVNAESPHPYGPRPQARTHTFSRQEKSPEPSHRPSHIQA